MKKEIKGFVTHYSSQDGTSFMNVRITKGTTEEPFNADIAFLSDIQEAARKKEFVVATIDDNTRSLIDIRPVRETGPMDRLMEKPTERPIEPSDLQNPKDQWSENGEHEVYMNLKEVKGYVTSFHPKNERSIDVAISGSIWHGEKGMHLYVADKELQPAIKKAFDERVKVRAIVDEGRVLRGLEQIHKNKDTGPPRKYWTVQPYEDGTYKAHKTKEAAMEVMQKLTEKNGRDFVVLEVVAHCRAISETETTDL